MYVSKIQSPGSALLNLGWVLWVRNEHGTYCIDHPDKVSTYMPDTVTCQWLFQNAQAIIYLFVTHFRRLWMRSRYVLAVDAIHGPLPSPLCNIVLVYICKPFPPFGQLYSVREGWAAFAHPSQVRMGHLGGC